MEESKGPKGNKMDLPKHLGRESTLYIYGPASADASLTSAWKAQANLGISKDIPASFGLRMGLGREEEYGICTFPGK